ncbi:uncharacterized protein TNIN_13661 [Trichonephila inaurata madagascariensis]|uniref:Uncharacterized protein n=1 Tax=Trichonephila inaurata madagascariensis TaxID=2747483 RepID=A0A8X6MK89_9ARAC|nr:uncharacterized protein TNIN_13661 [Trichonephila inaurata madagascariensis]
MSLKSVNTTLSLINKLCIVKIAKRPYKKKLLNEILEIEKLAKGEDRRGPKALQNLKDFNIRSMIYNLAAVCEIKPSTLANSWKKLLMNDQFEPDTIRFKNEDFYKVLH